MKVLVLSPHPDDESIGCGGTLHKHVLEKDHVKVIFLTSGEEGGHGRTKEETLKIRESEACRAAAVLGLDDIAFWREPDGKLRLTRRLVDKLVEELQNQKPDLVYVTNQQEYHPDHRAASRLVKSARRQTASPLKVLEFEVWTPLITMDEIIDITPWIDIKLAAVRAYKSQCRVLKFDDAMLGLARFRGEMYCWPKEPRESAGMYAEAFKLLA